MSIFIVCPKCHSELSTEHSKVNCNTCNYSANVVEGCIDIVSSSFPKAEKDFYDSVYSKVNTENSQSELPEYVETTWTDQLFPSGRYIVEKMGNVSGKNIVCLGNGVSVKEARFALHGANLCLSDLSISAVVALRRLLQPLGHNDKITYCSIDAYTLPFADNTVDIVYGFGFVHHLNDKVTFLHETLRVLKKGGMCIFFDDAYSPFWHTLKTTLLRPLMKYSHRKTGISPEDIRATYEGGFREKEIQRLGKICGFEDEYFFHRSELLGYLWIRGMQKLFYLSRNQQFFSIPAHIFAYLDTFLGKLLPVYRNNMIRLVWGFQK